jgi:hypothetical protein
MLNATKDKDAAREALSVIQGNYAPEIITAPDVFQDIAKWEPMLPSLS